MGRTIIVAQSRTDSALAGSQINEDFIFPFLRFYFNHSTIRTNACCYINLDFIPGLKLRNQ